MNESDTYCELAPPPELRQSVACFWVRRGDGRRVRVLPDACSDIVWREDSGATVAGPDTAAWLADTTRGQLTVGVRFLPGAGGAALGVPLCELRNQRVPLPDLGLDPNGQLNGAGQPREVLGALRTLATQLVGAGPPDPAVQAAALRLTDPGQRVDRLAGELGFSERQLRRRFLAAVGYGPKTLQRVLKLRRFLASGSGDLARAALEAGYTDQPHLSRECHALTGLSPAQLAGRV